MMVEQHLTLLLFCYEIILLLLLVAYNHYMCYIITSLRVAYLGSLISASSDSVPSSSIHIDVSNATV